MVLRETTCDAEGLLTCAGERYGAQSLLALRALHGNMYNTAYLQRRPFCVTEGGMGTAPMEHTGQHSQFSGQWHMRCDEG